MNKQIRVRRYEHGAILVTSLIFLAVVTILSMSSIRSSTIGVRMN